MKQDALLRETARAIYQECYPSDDWTDLAFDAAERYGTIHYRQAVGAAQRARSVMASSGTQLALPAIA
jgi:hypothetical protein